MNILEEHLKAHAAGRALTDRESGSMRLALAEHMRLRPLRVNRSWFGQLSLVRVGTPMLAAILLCSGTAYAAQAALPGDLLYPIKINVNEPVEVALATTPTAKATVEARVAEARVAEAQTLAARGTLTASTTQELEDNFNQHATEALALAGSASSTASAVVTVSSSVSVPASSLASSSTQVSTSTRTFSAVLPAATGVATGTAASASASEGTSTEKNFAVQLRASLHAQADILSALGSRLEPADGPHGTGHATTTATSTSADVNASFRPSTP